MPDPIGSEWLSAHEADRQRWQGQGGVRSLRPAAHLRGVLIAARDVEDEHHMMAFAGSDDGAARS